MATAEDGPIWSEDVCTLAEAVSSHTIPIIVRVVEGSYCAEESASMSQGDIFKVDFVNSDVITGNCCKEMPYDRETLTEDENIPSKQVSITQSRAEDIDVTICLKNPDKVVMATPNENSTRTKRNAYVDFSLPIPAVRTSIYDKTTPPLVPPRVKTRIKSEDEERKPMPPPRKLSTPNEPEHGTMGLQIPTSPVKPSKNETATTFWKEDNEEDIDDDVYEITDGQEDNIYDEPEDIELPRSSKTEHSLKYKTMEFLTKKIKVKDTVQKIKSKITNAMKREKTTTHVHKRDEDEDDGDYEIPDGTLARKTYTRYDTLEKRLTLRQTRNNAYSSLSVSDGIQKHTLFGSLSVAGLANRLVMCGLNDMAEMCLKEKVDGRLFLSLTDDDLREVFSVTELQIKKIHMAQEHDWTPKT